MKRSLVFGSLFLLYLFSSGTALADTGCNTFSFTFAQVLGQTGTFFENGGTDCISINITDRVISTEFSIVANEAEGPSDSLNFTNTGPGGTMDICFFSFQDSTTGGSCSTAANVTTITYPGDPAVEILSSGPIFDVTTGILWDVILTSADNPTTGVSDTLSINRVPEPASIMLLSSGLLAVAGLMRRKLSR